MNGTAEAGRGSGMGIDRKKFSPRIIGEILNIVHNAVLLIDSENRVFFANTRTAKMFKASIETMQGLTMHQLFMPEDRHILVPNILAITRERHEFESEAMLRCLDGSTFLGLVSCAFFRWDEEDCIAVTIHDITKMKAIERMLKHSERVAFLGHMLDDISHQIRNPILVIGGLSRRLGTGGSNDKYVETIVQESNRLEKLLDTLNAFIMLPPPQQQKIPLARLIENVEPRFKKLAELFGVRWECHYPATVLDKTVLIDITLLVEAMEALVLNACESYDDRHDDRVVIFEILATDEETWPFAVKITDRGYGIHANDLPYVSSHFFTKKTKHIGMGLTFAQRILEEQGGELTIESNEGEGTTVTLFLRRERRRPLRTKRI